MRVFEQHQEGARCCQVLEQDRERVERPLLLFLRGEKQWLVES